MVACVCVSVCVCLGVSVWGWWSVVVCVCQCVCAWICVCVCCCVCCVCLGVVVLFSLFGPFSEPPWPPGRTGDLSICLLLSDHPRASVSLRPRARTRTTLRVVHPSHA